MGESTAEINQCAVFECGAVQTSTTNTTTKDGCEDAVGCPVASQGRREQHCCPLRVSRRVECCYCTFSGCGSRYVVYETIKNPDSTPGAERIASTMMAGCELHHTYHDKEIAQFDNPIDLLNLWFKIARE